MRIENVKQAIIEANRFVRLAEKLESNCWAGSKVTGAVRRSSMDLTRALAEMRKP